MTELRPLSFLVYGFVAALSLLAMPASGRPETTQAADDGPTEAWTEKGAVSVPSTADISIRRHVAYARPGGQPQRADLYLPSASGFPGPRPAVVLIHGGGWRFGSKAQMATQARRLAERGFVAMAINYRLAPRDPYPAQVEDCREAVRWLQSPSAEVPVDPTRVALYGYSAGGHLACLVGATQAEFPASGEAGTQDQNPSPRVQAVVAGGAPCDLQTVPPDNDYLAYWLGGTRREAAAKYRAASPVVWVSPDDPPFFFFHGGRDWLVPAAIAQRMHRALQEAGVSSEFFICKGDGHFNAFLDRAAQEAAETFLTRILQP